VKSNVGLAAELPLEQLMAARHAAAAATPEEVEQTARPVRA
jgi:hypothetical protein